MRILWCHEVSYLDKPVYEYQDFPERLAARGHEVEVIDFREATPTRPVAMQVSRTGEGSVTLCSIPHHAWPAARYAEARWRFRNMLLERLRSRSFDAAFVYSVFINGSQTVRLCRRHGVPAVYRAIDAYHRLRPGAITQAILKSGERYIYRHADAILTTNEEMSRYVEVIAGSQPRGRLAVVDHGVDSRHFAPAAPDRALAHSLGIADDDRVAVFLGTTYAFSGLLGLIERLAQLRHGAPRLKLMVVGAGEQDADLRATVSRCGLQDAVVLTGMIPYPEVPRYLALAEVALNPFELNDITRDIVPIKILQYQAMGLPTVSTPLPDLYRKHPPEESGIVYSATDHPDAFADALVTLLADPRRASNLGRRGREFVSQRFSVDRAVTTIETTLAELAAERQGQAYA